MSADNPLDAPFHPQAPEATGTSSLDEAAGDLQRAAAEGELSLAAETDDPALTTASGSDAERPRDGGDAPPSADVLMDPGTGVLVRIGSVAGAASLPDRDPEGPTDPAAAEAQAAGSGEGEETGNPLSANAPGASSEPASSRPMAFEESQPEESQAEASSGPEAADEGQAASSTVEAEAGGDDSGDRDENEDEDEDALLEADLREPEQRRRSLVAPALIALDRIDEDTTFRIRQEGDVSKLATDLARVGQLFPIDVRVRGERFQVVCGFRRLAALRFLHREFVLARVHVELHDEDAQLMSLAAAIHAEPVARETLEGLRANLESEGRLSAASRDMLDKALQTDDSLAPESSEEEVDADELAGDVAQRLGAINQDLSLLADVFASLDASRRAELLMQLRYSAELVVYLEGQGG